MPNWKLATRISVRLAVLVGLWCYASSAAADTPVEQSNTDPNSVDIITGQFLAYGTDVSIGPEGPQGLHFTRPSWETNYDNWTTYLSPDGNGGFLVGFGATRDHVTGTTTNGVYNAVSVLGTGATFTSNAVGYVYTTPEGVQYQFEQQYRNEFYWPAQSGRVSTITYPSGAITKINYRVISSLCFSDGTLCRPISRVQSVTNNSGYQLHFDYHADAAPPLADAYAAVDAWQLVARVTAINNAVEYCAPTADDCAVAASWPRADYVWSTDIGFGQTCASNSQFPSGGCSRTITVYNGSQPARVWKQFYDAASRIVGIQLPGNPNTSQGMCTSTSCDIWLTYHANGKVASIKNAAGTTNYAYSGQTTTVTDALTNQTVIAWNVDAKRPSSITDPLGRITTFEYYPWSTPRNWNVDQRLKKVTAPEGNYTQYTYDSRGNTTEVRQVAKPGSALADIVSTASYDTTCTNLKKCNKPNSTVDPKGNQTDYVYDSNSGLLTTVTAPAPGGGNIVRPQVRNTVTAKFAWYRNSSGSIVQAATPIYLVTQSSSCASGSTCSGTATELKSTIVYGSSGVANNLLPTTLSGGAGTGAATATSTVAYDSVGNVMTIDGPLAGAGDTIRMRYDVQRRVIGIVGVDGDGSGARKNPAVRYAYSDSASGHGITADVGIVNSYSDADWQSFTVKQSRVTSADRFGRPLLSTVSANGSTLGVTQQSYDSAGRPDCLAVRMNPSAFDSPPAACSLGSSGTFGPDRIRRMGYNATSQVTSITAAFGTSLQQISATVTYTPNGQVQTVADAKGNLTSYEYDGLDRPVKTRLPDKQSSGVSSVTDYVEIQAYDANSNALTIRLRNGNLVQLARDNLDRLTLRDLSGTSQDVYYGYDNFGRVLSAHFGSAGGSGIDNTLDVTGSSSTTSTFGRAVSRTYDLATNTLTVQHPDAYQVRYVYDIAGEVGSILDSTNVTLAAYTYDDFGRRTGFGRDNSTSTGSSYDSLGRLATLSQDLTGTDYDSTTTFTYTPASEIDTRIQSNDSRYTWTPTASSTLTFTPNGLNQIASVNSTSTSYNTKADMTNDGGANNYGYNDMNWLTTASAATITLSYDPGGLLNSLTTSSSTTEFVYDGPDLIAEYQSGAVAKRYVHGSALDEPIAYYTGNLYSNSNRNYLTADERGSIVAFMNNAGTGGGSNKYTPDGEISALAGSRFGYTGQAWLAPLSLYYYKARMYSPRLASFVQPDPIGYGDGLNMYAYVHNDPINGWDPSGLGGPDDDTDGGWVIDTHGSPPTGSFSYGPIDLRKYYMFLNARWRSAASQVDSQSTRRKGGLWRKFGYGIADLSMANVQWSIDMSHSIAEASRGRGTKRDAVNIGLGYGMMILSVLPETGLADDALRGMGKFGGIFSRTKNAAGGEVWTSTGTIVQSDFAGIVNGAVMRNRTVNILTGAHGSPEGVITAERFFFDSDMAKFSGMDGVNVFDVTSLTPAEISAFLRGEGTTIGAFCNSAVCLSVF
jgi:RHS repeat-associated protein